MYLREQPEICQIACGGRHSLVVTNKGKLFVFGYGQNGQLGLRNNSNYAKPQLVKDMIQRPIAMVAAGWNHSLALTQNGDLYVTGYNQNGQLGLGDKESKTSFTHVTALGNKNIAKIFAGGNHSWVVLDDLVPIRNQTRDQSPIGIIDNARSSSNTPLRMNYISKAGTFENESKAYVRSNRNSSPFQPADNQRGFGKTINQSFMQQQEIIQPLGTGDDFVQKLLELQQQALQKAQYYVQITYCETEFCHRFINFEVHKQFVRQFEGYLEEYIQQCYSQEKGTLYHKVQEVPSNILSKKPTFGERLLQEQQNDIEENEYLEEEENSDDHKSYTLCIITNPNLYEKQFKDLKNQKEQEGKLKKVIINASGMQTSMKTVPIDENQAPLIGKIVFVKDQDIDGNFFEELMCQWVLNFHRRLAKYCVNKPRYSELRPMKYCLT